MFCTKIAVRLFEKVNATYKILIQRAMIKSILLLAVDIANRTSARADKAMLTPCQEVRIYYILSHPFLYFAHLQRKNKPEFEIITLNGDELSILYK